MSVPAPSPRDVLAVAGEFTCDAADWQLHAYGHARHAFTFKGADIPDLGILYDAAPDRRSWAVMEAFFEESLV